MQRNPEREDVVTKDIACPVHRENWHIISIQYVNVNYCAAPLLPIQSTYWISILSNSFLSQLIIATVRLPIGLILIRIRWWELDSILPQLLYLFSNCWTTLYCKSAAQLDLYMKLTITSWVLFLLSVVLQYAAKRVKKYLDAFHKTELALFSSFVVLRTPKFSFNIAVLYPKSTKRVIGDLQFESKAQSSSSASLRPPTWYSPKGAVTGVVETYDTYSMQEAGKPGTESMRYFRVRLLVFFSVLFTHLSYSTWSPRDLSTYWTLL